MLQSYKAFLVPLILLVLSGCDGVAGEAEATAKVPSSAFQFEVPEMLFFDEVMPIVVTLTNTTNATLYVGRPGLELFRVTGADFSTGSPVEASFERVYSPFTTAVLRANEKLLPGESRTMGLSLDLRSGGTATWSGDGPVDGQYVFGATLFTTPGDEDTLYRGALAPEGVSFTSPFELRFGRR